MKSSIRILTIGLALALLLVVPATFMDTVTAAEGDVITLSQDQIKWATADDRTREAGYYSPGPDDKAADNVTRGTIHVNFYLRDDDLTTTVTASTTITAKIKDQTEFSVRDIDYTDPIEPKEKDDPGREPLLTDATYDPSENDPDNKRKVTQFNTDHGIWTSKNTPYQKYLGEKREYDKDVAIGTGPFYEYKFGSTWQPYDKVNVGRRYAGGVAYQASGLTVPRPQPLKSVTRVSVIDSSGSSKPVAAAFVTGADMGTFTVVGAPKIEPGYKLSVEFTYHIADDYTSYAPTIDDDSTTTAIDESTKDYVSGYQRVKVTSSSDSVGEWVSLTEVPGAGSWWSTPAAESGYYWAWLVISDNPDDAGTGDVRHFTYRGGFTGTTTRRVWVQDGDTLTATYYSGNGDTSSSVIATASVLIDDTDPEISGITPVDGSLLSKSNEVISVGFAISDSGSGFETGGTADNNIKSLKVNRLRVSSGEFDLTGCTVRGGFTYPRVTPSGIDVVYAPGEDTWNGECHVNTTDNGTDEKNQNHHGLPFELEVTVVDKAGNEAKKSVELRLDSQPPSIVNGGVQAGKGWDASNQEVDKKPQLDSILVKFDESLNPATVDADDFNVVGFQVVSAEVVGVNADDDPIDQANQNRNEYVALTLSENLEPDSKPQVSIVGGVEDEAGNIRSGTSASPVEKKTSLNTLAPNVTVDAFTALLTKGGEQAISYSADEALRAIFNDDKGTRVSVSGSGSGRGVMGDRESVSISLSTTMQASGTFKQKDISKTGIYGVMVQAVDRDGNITNKGSVKVTEEDVSDGKVTVTGGPNDTFTFKVDNWPIADHNVDGSVADSFLLMVDGSAIDSTTTEIDWSEDEKITVQVADGAITADDSVKVTYYYVDAAQVIQVDTKAPSASFTPGEGESTDDTTPFIQIDFDDDEYAGDTHKTVTLTAASLKATDGTPTDIMDSISTTDNIEFIYVATEELALGEYEITVSATDEAGNELKEESSTFTVKARAMTTITLQPSWNLISLRGAPVSLDINDIITDPSIETVSSYDPSLASPWTVWIRGADGMLESSPAGRTRINPGHGLWVRSSTGQDLEVDIPGLSRDDVAALPPSISLVRGWNLVAAASVDPSVKTLDPDVYFAGLNWVRVYEFNALTGRLEGAQPSSDADDDDNDEFMDVGKGYWVYLTEAGTVIP